MKVFRPANRPSYYIRLRRGGVDKWVCLHTSVKREAEDRAARYAYSQLPENIRAVATPPETPLSDAWRQYLLSDSARAATESSLKSKFMVWDAFRQSSRCRTMESVTPAVAGEYLRMVAKRSSPQTAKHHKSSLSAIWKSVWPDRDNPWTKTAPMPVLHAEKYRAYSDDEIDRILSACNDEWRRLVQIGLYTGLRLSDAVSVAGDSVVDG
jgi:hypothetical protein